MARSIVTPDELSQWAGDKVWVCLPGQDEKVKVRTEDFVQTEPRYIEARYNAGALSGVVVHAAYSNYEQAVDGNTSFSAGARKQANEDTRGQTRIHNEVYGEDKDINLPFPDEEERENHTVLPPGGVVQS